MRAVKTRYALVIAERARLGREIHDTLLQSLAALGPELEALATRVSPDEDATASELRRLRRQVDRSVRDARESILELRRHALRAPRLAESLTQLAADTETRHGVRSDRQRHRTPTRQRVAGRGPAAVPHRAGSGRPTPFATDTPVASISASRTTTATSPSRSSTMDAASTHTRKTNAPADASISVCMTMRERAEQVGGALRIDSAPTAERRCTP